MLTWIHALAQSAPSAAEILTRIRTLAWIRDLSWIHAMPLTALSAAVMTLGLVILLELRAIARLRRALDGGLKRVFEQLDLLCFENQRLSETQSLPAVRAQAGSPSRPPVREAAAEPPVVNGYQNERSLVRSGLPPEQIAERSELGAGEARLLAALAAARARRTPAEAGAPAGIRPN